VDTYSALIFWPLHPLVQRVIAMLWPMHLCTIEDGRRVHLDLRREEVRCHSCRYPRCCRGMNVMVVEWSGSCRIRAWFSCSCTVMSIPSAGVGTVVGGPMAPHLSRWLRVSFGRGGRTLRGVGRFDDVMGARARRKPLPEAPISPETCSTSGVKHALSISNHTHEHHPAFIITCNIGVTLSWNMWNIMLRYECCNCLFK
jgi:hypothetical protein